MVHGAISYLIDLVSHGGAEQDGKSSELSLTRQAPTASATTVEWKWSCSPNSEAGPRLSTELAWCNRGWCKSDLQLILNLHHHAEHQLQCAALYHAP